VVFNIILINICVLLGYYVEYIGNILPKLRDKISIQFTQVKKSKKSFAFWISRPFKWIRYFVRNIDNVIPLCAPKYHIVVRILLPSHRKPDITHFNSLSIAFSFIVQKFNCCSIFTCIVVLKHCAYVPVRVQLRTWLVTLRYVLNAVAFVWSEN